MMFKIIRIKRLFCFDNNVPRTIHFSNYYYAHVTEITHLR